MSEHTASFPGASAPGLLPLRHTVRLSDLATAPLGQRSARVDGAWVDSVPSCPEYYHGNRLVLDAPPDAASIDRWCELHRELFAWRDGDYPVIVTWYDELAAPVPSFCNEAHTALLAPGAFDAPKPAGLAAEPAADEEAWEAIAVLEALVHPQHASFHRTRLAQLRVLAELGRGSFRTLRDGDGAVVASAGGYVREGVGRYANVVTHPAWRRRGCAAFLIGALLDEMKPRAGQVVIVAESGGDAERLYESLGFEPILSVRSVERGK